jgi:cell wall assembly regulator SMI1
MNSRIKRKRIVIIGSLAVVAAIVLAGLFVPRMARNFFYPAAPTMPAVTSRPMDQLLIELEAFLKTQAPKVLEQMQPGISNEELAKLEQQAGIQFADDIRALYRWHNGSRSRDPQFDGPIPGHRFVPLDEVLGVPTMVSNQVAGATPVQRAAFSVLADHRKSWLHLFDDGAGDGYFFDPKRKPSEGSVFYCFAEDGTYLFFPSIRNLLAGVVKCYEQGAFFWKDDPAGSHLETDFQKAERIWDEFGSSKLR